MTLTVEDREAFATWHRLSPRMLLVHPVQELIRSFPVLLGAAFAGASNGHASYTGLGVAGLITLYSLTRWFTTRLQITADQVQLRHGLLRRRTIATARDRIRTVDVTSHLLHRVLGLARVTIGTGINDRKGEGRLILDGLTAGQADRLRADLLHRVPTAAPAADLPESARPAEPVELARLDPRWIRLAPLTLSGVAAGVVLWTLFWRIRGESGVNVANWGPIHGVTERLHRMPIGGEVAVLIAAALVFVAVTSTVGYVLLFWNFRLVRHEEGTLQVTRGLLTTRATSIERRRLVGVEFSQPLLLRAAGAVRTLAVATGLRTGRGAERGGEVLLPPAPHEVATALAERVLDGTPAITAKLVRHGPAARRRRLLRAGLGGAVLCAATLVAWAAGAPFWVVVVGLAVLAASPALGIDRYRGLGHVRTDGYVVTRFGSLVRRRTALAEHAVIGATVRATFFQRRAGLATLTLTTAAGKQGYPVIDIDESAALELADATLNGLVGSFAP